MSMIASLALSIPFIVIFILMCIKVYKIVKVKRRRAKFRLIQGEKKEKGPYE